MSTLTTIKIITDRALQPLPPRPFLRFYGRVLAYAAATGVLTIQELPAFLVTFGPDGEDEDSATPATTVLPTLSVVLPATGLDPATFSRDVILQQQVVSVLGHLEPDGASVTLHSLQPLQNQRLFDLGYENDRYSNTVLEKVELARHIAQNS